MTGGMEAEDFEVEFKRQDMLTDKIATLLADYTRFIVYFYGINTGVEANEAAIGYLNNAKKDTLNMIMGLMK
jgi:hypothetical protein